MLMKKLYLEQQQKRDRRGLWTTAVILLILGLVCTIRIMVANQLVEASEKLHRLETRRAELLAQKELLSQQVTAAKSLVKIRIEASAMGFVPAEKAVYVNISLPLAAKLP